MTNDLIGLSPVDYSFDTNDSRTNLSEAEVWKWSYNKMEPKDNPVPKWNPFFLEKTEVAEDKHMGALFKKLPKQKWKENT